MIEKRRKFIRLGSKIDFDYKIKGSESHKVRVTTKNISSGGIQALMDKKITKSTWLELDIHIPNLKKPLSCIGKVIWTADEKSGKIDVGIKFEEIDPEMKNKFLEHLYKLTFSELERLKV